MAVNVFPIKKNLVISYMIEVTEQITKLADAKKLVGIEKSVSVKG